MVNAVDRLAAMPMLPQNAMHMPVSAHPHLAGEGGMPDLKAMAAAVGRMPGGPYSAEMSMQGMPRVRPESFISQAHILSAVS